MYPFFICYCCCYCWLLVAAIANMYCCYCYFLCIAYSCFTLIHIKLPTISYSNILRKCFRFYVQKVNYTLTAQKSLQTLTHLQRKTVLAFVNVERALKTGFFEKKIMKTFLFCLVLFFD